MRLVEYDYKPDFASEMGVDRPHETGNATQVLLTILKIFSGGSSF